MQIHELYTSSEAWQNAPGTYESKVASSENIPTFINALYVLERVAGKICIHLSQFLETEALRSKNISVMPALCLMLQI